MFERVLTTADGRTPLAAPDLREPTDAHRLWLRQMLEESPASLQSVHLGNVADGEITMEWQAVFTGAGVAYFHLNGKLKSACLLLHGRHATSEIAAIDALQQTLQFRNKAPGFEYIRRTHARPLRAMVLLPEPLAADAVSVLNYWADCLAFAYFSLLGAASPAARSGDHVPLRA